MRGSLFKELDILGVDNVVKRRILGKRMILGKNECSEGVLLKGVKGAVLALQGQLSSH